MNRTIILLIFLTLWGCKTNLQNQFQKSTTSTKPVWLIPDAITAEKIARAVLEAHIGVEDIRPEVFKAELKDDSIWVVKSLKRQWNNNGKMEDFAFGGGYIFELSRHNGKIKNIEISK